MPSERVTVTLPPEVVGEIDRLEKNRSRFILKAVRREIARRRRKGFLLSLQNPHPESLAMAELGFDEWAAGLPKEDLSDLLDPAMGREIRWEPGRGWVEVGK